MRIKTLSLTFIIVLSLSLSACGGAPATNSISEVETVAAMTFQAMTSQALTEQAMAPQATESPIPATAATSTAGEAGTVPTATLQAAAPAPTVLSPASPATIYPKGNFVPYSAAQCEALRSEFEKAIGAPVVVETTPFSDRVTGGTGTACRVHGTGTGATYTMVGGPFGTLVALLPTLGWTEDNINYGAGGPTGMATGFTKGGALGLLSVGWRPSADANCPKDQPISMCPLTPEQHLYDVTFDVADMVVYNPPAANGCNLWLSAIQPALPVAAVLETVNFTDFEMNTGTACQVRAEGTGVNFADIGDTAQAIDAILIPLGWTLVNGADGPTGTGREYIYGNMVAVVFVQWKPAPGANCPSNQPISACPLTPEQKLYTVTVALAEK